MRDVEILKIFYINQMWTGSVFVKIPQCFLDRNHEPATRLLMWSNLERTCVIYPTVQNGAYPLWNSFNSLSSRYKVYINTAPHPLYLQSPFFSASSKTKTRREKMFSKTVSVSASSLTTKGGDTFKSAVDGSSFSKLKSLSFSQKTRSFKVSATSIEANNFALTGVVFQPFEELKKDYLAVPIIPHVSMARQTYSDECEAAINEQIKWVVRFRYLFIPFWKFSVFLLIESFFVL